MLWTDFTDQAALLWTDFTDQAALLWTDFTAEQRVRAGSLAVDRFYRPGSLAVDRFYRPGSLAVDRFYRPGSLAVERPCSRTKGESRQPCGGKPAAKRLINTTPPPLPRFPRLEGGNDCLANAGVTFSKVKRGEGEDSLRNTMPLFPHANCATSSTDKPCHRQTMPLVPLANHATGQPCH